MFFVKKEEMTQSCTTDSNTEGNNCCTAQPKGKVACPTDDLAVVVSLKEGAVPATVCYCFDWTKEKIKAELDETGATIALEDIKAKMEKPRLFL